jgi:hypothetical protein
VQIFTPATPPASAGERKGVKVRDGAIYLVDLEPKKNRATVD